MSTDPKPSDDLREGLGLLFRAAKNIAKDLTPEKAEKIASETGGEVLRVVTVVGEAVGTHLGRAAEAAEAAVEKMVHDKKEAASKSEPPTSGAPPSSPPPPASSAPPPAAPPDK